MQTHSDRKSKRHGPILRTIWALSWIAASWMPACASSPAPLITAPCVPPPIVSPCLPPPEPVRLDTQADLLAAYIDALAAWAVCRTEVEKIRMYYTLTEGNDDGKTEN